MEEVAAEVFTCSTCNTTFPAKKEFIKHVREMHFK